MSDLKCRMVVTDGLPTIEFDREALRRLTLEECFEDVVGITGLRADLSEAIRLLRRVEWTVEPVDDDFAIHVCRWCEGVMVEGHEPGCALAALLEKHKG